MKNKINGFLKRNFEVKLCRCFPRQAVQVAKNHFKDKEIKAIEIGVAQGWNAKNMLKELNIKKMYLVDPYISYSDFDKKKLIKFEREAKKILRGKYIAWINKISKDARAHIKEKVDFIYIDGEHSYKAVMQDLNSYYDVVEEGGIVSGNDFGMKEVALAVIDFCRYRKVEFEAKNNDWWIFKK